MLITQKAIATGLHKYILAGIINTAIGFTIITLAFSLTHNPTATIGISASLGYLYSLLTYHYIAFNGQSKRPPFIRYAIIFGTAFILNSSATGILLKHLDNFIGVQILILPLIIVGQWAASKYWVFKPRGKNTSWQ